MYHSQSLNPGCTSGQQEGKCALANFHIAGSTASRPDLVPCQKKSCSLHQSHVNLSGYLRFAEWRVYLYSLFALDLQNNPSEKSPIARHQVHELKRVNLVNCWNRVMPKFSLRKITISFRMGSHKAI